jgi:hypothetical protein
MSNISSGLTATIKYPIILPLDNIYFIILDFGNLIKKKHTRQQVFLSATG